ncbi:MAG: aminotransferase class III-fold pyridoxal phosphate-dependent enzyme [Gammaproteobacteria bacterium]|nr:aminotransferase class III-fold pyridoxal phosphate-dependent enzyme [Gammaproteobacteria bacterium]
MTGFAIEEPESDLVAQISEARTNYIARNPKSQERYEAAREVMPGANTRTVLHYDPFPVTISRGDGAKIFDVDGHEYNDFLGEYTAGLYGHNNPVISSAVHRALDQGVALGGPNLIEAKFARLMCERFPAVERIRFCNSGTEANMLALSAARAFSGRTDIMVVDGSYHGSVLTFVGDSPLNLPFPVHRIEYNDTEAAIETIRKLGKSLAAVLVEPVIGAGGGIPASVEFLKGMRSATEETDALLIFDEVMTSRLTAEGLHGHYQITPDLVTFGKYLGGGLTFGAFGGCVDIMDHFDPRSENAWLHAGTFNNNILTMAAGFAGLSEVYTEQVADEFFDRGNRFRDSLIDAVSKLGLPVQISGLGSMMTFHFCFQQPTQPGQQCRRAAELYELIHLDMMARGQFYARRGMINLSLPMSDEQLEEFISDFCDVLKARSEVISATARE